MDPLTGKLVIGIDGGGTSTRLVLASDKGEVLGTGKAGPSNIDDIGVEKATENIRLCLNNVWQESGLTPRRVDAAFMGMAGVVSAADRQLVRGIALDLDLAPIEQVGIDHDIRIALAGGLALKPGIVLIVGTGSSCYGRTSDETFCRVGGWGHLLDDEGSGYYLGVEAMKAVIRSIDGRLGPTVLVEKINTALHIQDEQEIMLRLYHPPMSRADIAALAPVVLEAAMQGDEVANAILETGFAGSARLVEVAAKRLNFPGNKPYVTVTGGLAHSGSFFKDALYKAILTRVPGAQIQEPILSPVMGAVLLAIRQAGTAPSGEDVNRLQNNGFLKND